MSKSKVQAPKKEKVQGPKRERKNSFERKCVDKATKRLFAGATKEVKRLMDKVTKEARKLEYAIMNYNVKKGANDD